MQTTEINIMSGPNYWSRQFHSLISIKVESHQSLRADSKIVAQLNNSFPNSNFLNNPGDPVSIPGILGMICIELQCRAGMPCEFSMFKLLDENRAYIVFEYVVEKAGIYAGEAALQMITAWAEEKAYPIEEVIANLKQIKKDYGLGPTSGYILGEVKSRNIPIRHLDAGSLVALGYGKHQKKIRTAVADTTSGIGIEMAGDKEETKNILAQANVPVPGGIIVYSEQELRKRIHEIKFPIVIKPLNGNHGRGVTTHIFDLERALFGFRIASKISEEVIIEEYIPGDDHRFLVINFKLVAVAKRTPAMITGDGVSDILTLIEEENKNPQRGSGDEHVLSTIVVDDVTKKILSEKKLGLHTVLEKGQTLILKDTANISAGGTATDLTGIVHPQNKFMVERIARLFGLDICGVDIMTTAVDHPITRETGAVIEVNAGPGIRMHSNPQNGTERNVAAPIIDMLFPEEGSFHIPIIAIAGTTYKTKLIRSIAKAASGLGRITGYNGSEGLFINGFQLKAGICTDKKSYEDVLFDPMIDFAVLDCSDKYMFSSGLPFKECDVSIILTLKGDYTDDFINPAQLKAALAGSTKRAGFVVLNADDREIVKLSHNLSCQAALFSIYPGNEFILKHKESGHLVGMIENNRIRMYKGNQEIVLEHIDNPDISSADDEYKAVLLAATITRYILETTMFISATPH